MLWTVREADFAFTLPTTIMGKICGHCNFWNMNAYEHRLADLSLAETLKLLRITSGPSLRARRIVLGLSVHDLAQQWGMDIGIVEAWERGAIDLPPDRVAALDRSIMSRIHQD